MTETWGTANPGCLVVQPAPFRWPLSVSTAGAEPAGALGLCNPDQPPEQASKPQFRRPRVSSRTLSCHFNGKFHKSGETMVVFVIWNAPKLPKSLIAGLGRASATPSMPRVSGAGTAGCCSPSSASGPLPPLPLRPPPFSGLPQPTNSSTVHGGKDVPGLPGGCYTRARSVAAQNMATLGLEALNTVLNLRSLGLQDSRGRGQGWARGDRSALFERRASRAPSHRAAIPVPTFVLQPRPPSPHARRRTGPGGA